jgi:hypothetical protein
MPRAVRTRHHHRAAALRGASTATITLLAATARADAAPTIQPNTSIPGTAEAQRLVGGLWTLGFVAATAGFVLGLAMMGIAGHSGNAHLRERGRVGVVASLIAVVLLGAANALLQWAEGVGQSF